MRYLLVWVAALVLLCVVSGRWQPHLVADSASYLDYSFASSQAMARQTRFPVYPAILRAALVVSPNEMVGLQLIVALQIILHATAVSFLATELVRWGLTRWTAVAAAATVAIGCPFWDNVSTITTDCAAMSLGVMTATCVLRGWRTQFSIRLAVGVALCSLLAISLRPAYLFLLPWSILMLLLRPCVAGHEYWLRRCRDVAVFLPLPVVLLLGWCLFRYSAIDDFSLLPFGHQNMAAVTTQLLDNDELQQIPGPTGELASLIAVRRVEVSRGLGSEARTRRGSADGLDLRTMSAPSLRADSYMTIENRWDAMTYFVVIPAAAEIAGDDPVEQHRVLAQLDRQIVQAYPLRYLRWWLLAVRRGIWGSVANIFMQPIFLTVIVLCAGATVVRCVQPRSCTHSAALDETQRAVPALIALTLIAITYAASGLGFVALTSPTIGRFSDAVFVFMPALVAIAVVLRTREWLRDDA